jgi:hypothetical protein
VSTNPLGATATEGDDFDAKAFTHISNKVENWETETLEENINRETNEESAVLAVTPPYSTAPSIVGELALAHAKSRKMPSTNRNLLTIRKRSSRSVSRSGSGGRFHRHFVGSGSLNDRPIRWGGR